MRRYEYSFVSVPRAGGLKAKRGSAFASCQKAIQEQAEKGWRLKQIVTEFDEKTGVFSSSGYQIVFECRLSDEA